MTTMRIAIQILILSLGFCAQLLGAAFPLFAARTATTNAAPSGPDPLFLNTHGGAEVAYSVRKLDTNYAGSCIRIRRASDDAEQDIGFSGDNLDTAAAESFCSATDGFIVKWYDQSGNANDAVNATAASQPRIVSSGTIESDGGKAVLNFRQLSGTDKFLALGTAVTGAVDWSVACVWVRTSSSHNITPLSSTGSPQAPFIGTSIGYDMYVDSDSGYCQFNVYDLKAAMVAIAVSGDSDLYINNSFVIAAVGYTSHASGSSFNNIGAASTFSTYGSIHELVLWPSDKTASVSGISGNVNTYYGIY
jgi:hypothetical protein